MTTLPECAVAARKMQKPVQMSRKRPWNVLLCANVVVVNNATENCHVTI